MSLAKELFEKLAHILPANLLNLEFNIFLHFQLSNRAMLYIISGLVNLPVTLLNGL
jgi:hypothetical protein